MTDHKADVTLWAFQFVVKANTWSDVVKILKDTLDIVTKRNASDREINGLYLVTCFVDEDKITKNFYRSIAASESIAVHSDNKSASLYPKILKETQEVEEKLRWLLLHVSDAIEDYAALLGSERSEIIEAASLDPLTARLSFEATLALLELDQSWAREGVNDARMRTLISDNADFDSFKKNYLEKTTPKTIWDSISELVLSHPVKWGTISPKLKSIKVLRNKCAHFCTVTNDDLSQAQHLNKQIMRNLTKKKPYTSTNAVDFANLNKQLAETMKRISRQMQPIAESALVAQKAILENSNLNASLQGSMRASEAISKLFLKSNGLDSSLRTQAAALASLPKINFTAINIPQPTIDSISRVQRSLGGLGVPSQAKNDMSADQERTDDIETSNSVNGNKE